MKKILITLLTVIMLTLSFSGCDKSSTLESSTLEGYDYTEKSTEEFQFKTFIGVPSKMKIYNAEETSFYEKYVTDEEFDNYYKEMKEAGFTIASAPYNTEDVTHNLRMLDAAKKYGLKQILGELIDDDGISLTKLVHGGYNDPFNKNYDDYTDAEIEAALVKLFAPYLNHSAFYGIAVFDEPNIKHYDRIAKIKNIFDKVAPNKLFYVNLLPINASLDSLGVATNEERLNYVNYFTDKINTDYISYDYYGLVKGADGKKEIGEAFLYNMQVYKTRAVETNRKLWTYLLSTPHTFGTSEFLNMESQAEFNWQTYSFMAFGGEGISWFTYFPSTPLDSHGTEFKVGAYDRKGRKTDTYYYIKNIQNEINNFDEVYLNFKWQNVMTILGEKNDNGFTSSYDYLDEGFAKKSNDRIKSYKCKQDTLIGTFKDSNNNDAFMVVNYSNPALQLKNNVILEFNDAYAAVVYINGVKKIVALKDGKLEMELATGDGAFVIPLKKI